VILEAEGEIRLEKNQKLKESLVLGKRSQLEETNKKIKFNFFSAKRQKE